MPGPAQFSRKICFADFELNLETAELRNNGNKTMLPGQPFQVLVTLLDRPGELVTREELKKRLWASETFVDFDQSLNKAINRLREALEDSAEHPRFIETLPRRGYRFIGTIESKSSAGVADQTGDPSPEVPAIEGVQPDGHSTSSREAAAPPHIYPSAGKYLWAALIALMLTVALGVLISKWRNRSPSSIGLAELQIAKLTESGRAEDVAISPDGRYVVYALRSGGEYSLHLRQVSTVSDVEILPRDLGAFHGLTFSPDGSYIFFVREDRNDPFFKYLYSVPALGGAVRRLITDVDSPISFSPDGTEFVYEHCLPPQNDIEVMIAKSDGSDAHRLALIHNGNSFMYEPGPNWSPDGRTIALPVMLLDKPQRWVLDVVSAADGTVRELYSSSDVIGRPVWIRGNALLFPHFDPISRRGQLWTISFPEGSMKRLTTDAADYRTELEITRDKSTAVAITQAIRSSVWSTSSENLSHGRPATFDDFPVLFIAETSEQELLVVGEDGSIWKMELDNHRRVPFGDLRNASWLSQCGSYVVTLVAGNGTQNLTRINADGTNPTTLVSGNLWAPVCSPDGKSIFYANFDAPQKIWNISVNGGAPSVVSRILGDSIAGWLNVSPDGKLLAYPYTRYSNTPAPGWTLVVMSVKGGDPLRTFNIPGDFLGPYWAPDGQSLEYVLTRDGASNIWEQPLTGGKPAKLTRFTSDRIFYFSWSPDRRRLWLTRGEVSTNVVLLSNLHPGGQPVGKLVN